MVSLPIVANAETIANGICGDDLTWELDADGTLIISGTGSMNYYANYTYVPWDSYKQKIKSLVIEQGVKSIGNFAFSDCNILSSVFIPNSVTELGCNTFAGCHSLTSITLPDSITDIDSGIRYVENLDGVEAIWYIDDDNIKKTSGVVFYE